MISASTLTQILINGLTAGSFYVLMALGFTLIFGILRLVNFAHGEFYMIGAFVTYYLISKFTINYFLAIALSTVVVGVIGFAIEKALFAPLRGRELSMLISALGLQITIQGLIAVWVGVDSYSIAPPFTGIIEFDIFSFPVERIFVVGLTLLVLLLFYLLIKFTMIGKALRAVALDDEAAQMQGIPVNRVYTLAFGLGCSLAAIAGALIGPVFSLHVYMGQAALLKAFIVVILGGLGSIPGAVLGGLILGFGESAFATLLGGLTAEMFGFGLIIFILLLRPSGLLGRPQL